MAKLFLISNIERSKARQNETVIFLRINYAIMDKMKNNIAILTLYLTLVGTITTILAYLNDTHVFTPNKKKYNSEETILDKGYSDCYSVFPNVYNPSKLFILVTRFEDYSTLHNKSCYGRGIETLIEKIRNQYKLPIDVCYDDSHSPNQKRDALLLMKKANADIIIWGKLRNAHPNCVSEAFCLKFSSADSILINSNKPISSYSEFDYQKDVSIEQIEEGTILMGNEQFEEWLIGMSNIKIGKKNAELYTIPKSAKIDAQIFGLTEKAKIYSSIGDYESADNFYNHAIQLIKLKSKETNTIYYNHVTLYINASVCKIFQSKNNEAISIISSVIHIIESLSAKNDDFSKLIFAIHDLNKSKISNLYYIRAKAYINSNKLDSAIYDCEKSIKINPANDNAYFLLGRAFSISKDYDNCIKNLNKAVELNRANALYVYNRAIAYYKNKNYKKALDDINYLIEKNKNDPKYFVLRANIYGIYNQYKSAINECNYALLIDSANYNAKACRAVSLYLTKSYSKALLDYNYVISLNKNISLSSYTVLGEIKLRLKKYDEAINDLNKVINSSDKKDEAFKYRSMAYKEKGLLDMAIKDCKIALKSLPNDAELLNHFAKLNEYFGKNSTAEFYYERAINIEPVNFKYKIDLINFLRHTKRQLKAIKLFISTFAVSFILLIVIIILLYINRICNIL